MTQMKSSRVLFFTTLLAAFALSAVRADSIQASLNTSNSMILHVTVPGPGGYNGNAYVGAFDVARSITPGNVATGFCIDLHTAIDSALHTGLNVTGVAANTLTGGLGGSFPNSAYTDAGNRIAYVMSNVSTFEGLGTSLTAVEYAAAQLAIWKITDSGFTFVNSGPNSALTGSDVGTAYSGIISLINGNSLNAGPFGNVAGYNPGVSYSSTALLMDSSNSYAYQDLVVARVNFVGLPSVPEPASVISMGIAVAALSRLLRKRVTGR